MINGSIVKCQQLAYYKIAIIINAILEIHDAWEAQAVLRTQIHDYAYLSPKPYTLLQITG